MIEPKQIMCMFSNLAVIFWGIFREQNSTLCIIWGCMVVQRIELSPHSKKVLSLNHERGPFWVEFIGSPLVHVWFPWVQFPPTVQRHAAGAGSFQHKLSAGMNV